MDFELTKSKGLSKGVGAWFVGHEAAPRAVQADVADHLCLENPETMVETGLLGISVQEGAGRGVHR